MGRKTGGRTKGTPNKTSAVLKDAILEAAEKAGADFGPEGMVSYLVAQAKANPGPFLSLLGKVLPIQMDATIEQRSVVRAPVVAKDADEWKPSQPTSH